MFRIFMQFTPFSFFPCTLNIFLSQAATLPSHPSILYNIYPFVYLESVEPMMAMKMIVHKHREKTMDLTKQML